MIEIVNDINEANFITHSGKFHADEIFATILLEKIYQNIKLMRVSEIDSEDYKDKTIFDIGGGKFDHHQVGGNGERSNGIKFASFGLLWNEYGKEYLKEVFDGDIDYCHKLFDKNFVQFIDAVDNGQVEFEKIEINVVSVSDIIEDMNPAWDEDVDQDAKFEDALKIAKVIFDNEISKTISKCRAKIYVDKAIRESENGIMVLEEYMPYQEFVLESEDEKAKDVLYVVFKSNRGGYNVRCIAKEQGSFDCRKKFPEEWAGLRNEELQAVTGVKTASFCHNARFICVAGNMEDAIALAKLAAKN